MRSRRTSTQVKPEESSRAWHLSRGFGLQETKLLHTLEVTGSQDPKLRTDGTPGNVDQAARQQHPNLESAMFIIFPQASLLVLGQRNCDIRSTLCSPSERKRNPGSLTSREELSQKLLGEEKKSHWPELSPRSPTGGTARPGPSCLGLRQFPTLFAAGPCERVQQAQGSHPRASLASS